MEKKITNEVRAQIKSTCDDLRFIMDVLDVSIASLKDSNDANNPIIKDLIGTLESLTDRVIIDKTHFEIIAECTNNDDDAGE